MKDKDEIIRMKNTREYRDPGKITEPPTVRSVDAVLLEDILSTIPTSTVILKLDIEGYECKVSFFLTFPSAFRMCRLCRYRFFWERRNSSFLLSFWNGPLLSGAFQINQLWSHFSVVALLCWYILCSDSKNCPEYKNWKQAFQRGGYRPYTSGEVIFRILKPKKKLTH